MTNPAEWLRRYLPKPFSVLTPGNAPGKSLSQVRSCTFPSAKFAKKYAGAFGAPQIAEHNERFATKQLGGKPSNFNAATNARSASAHLRMQDGASASTATLSGTLGRSADIDHTSEDNWHLVQRKNRHTAADPISVNTL